MVVDLFKVKNMTKILGHEEIVSSLEKSVSEKRTAHSYLFSGIAGIGKKLIAIEFACMLNCPSYSFTEHERCGMCVKIRKGNHPDVRVEGPQKGSIRIDRVRQLQGFLKYAPMEAPYRVIIIDDAHLINRAAQNALLKTLEEPPGGSVLVLITDKASSLLPTVRSRLRTVKFAPLERSMIAREITRLKHLGQDEATCVAGLASGSLGRALELLTANTLKFRKDLVEFLSQGNNLGLATLLDLSFRLSSDAQKLIDTIEFGMTWIRDLIILKTGGAVSCVVNADLVDILTTSAQHHSISGLLSVFNEMATALGLLASDTNINRNLLTDVMFLKIRDRLNDTMG